MGIAAAASAVMFFVFRAAPRLATASWAIAVFFIPVWVGVSAGIFYTVITAVTLLCIAAAIDRGFRWHIVDLVLFAFAVMLIGAFLLGDLIVGHLVITLIDWILPYIWGRIALARVDIDFVTTAIAIVTTAAASLAIIEFLTRVNVFTLVDWGNRAFALWSPLQPRGSFLRAEGAFGHSISLGSALAIGSIFVMTARWKLAVRLMALGLIGCAIVMSFSRIGLVAFVLGLVLAVLFLADELGRRVRAAVLAAVLLAAVLTTPFLTTTFQQAGDEAAGSALYRLDLIELLPQMAPFGLSPAYTVLPDNTVLIGGFESIDSAMLLTGLRLGWIPLVVLLFLLVASIAVVLRGRGNRALVALVAQTPGLATVALITQLPNLVWFVAGLGLTLYILDRGRARPPDVDAPEGIDVQGHGVLDG